MTKTIPSLTPTNSILTGYNTGGFPAALLNNMRL